MPESTCR